MTIRIFCICRDCGARNDFAPEEYLAEMLWCMNEPRPNDYFRCGWHGCQTPITRFLCAGTSDEAEVTSRVIAASWPACRYRAHLQDAHNREIA